MLAKKEEEKVKEKHKHERALFLRHQKREKFLSIMQCVMSCDHVIEVKVFFFRLFVIMMIAEN